MVKWEQCKGANSCTAKLQAKKLTKRRLQGLKFVLLKILLAVELEYDLESLMTVNTLS